MFPAGFAYAIVVGFVFMVDMLLAGFIIGKAAIAVVAIGLPCYGMFLALVNATVHGTELRCTWILGAGDNKYYKHSFAGGFYFTVLLSLAFFFVIQIFAKQLIIGFGGSKLPPEIFPQALLYLRICSPMIVFCAVYSVPLMITGVLGYQVIKVSANVINIACNLIFSVTLVILLPQEWKLAGLGIGSSSAAMIEALFLLIAAKVKKMNMSFRPTMLSIREIASTFRSGLPASLDNVIDCIAAAVSNNILITFFPEEPLIISTVAVVNNIKKIARMAPTGIGYAASTLFGVLYSERDKSGLKRSVWEVLRFGSFVTLVWAAIVFAVLPLLMKVYGMPANHDVRLGSIFQLGFLLFFLVVFVLTIFYGTLWHVAFSCFYS